MSVILSSPIFYFIEFAFTLIKTMCVPDTNHPRNHLLYIELEKIALDEYSDAKMTQYQKEMKYGGNISHIRVPE
jgi:hypothetical protein